MTYCSDCGTELTENASFCASCGEPVESNIQNEDEPENLSSTTSSESDDESTEVSENEPETDGIQWKRVGMATVFSLVPAFIAYVSLSLATGGSPVALVFFLGIPIFGYLLYQRPTAKAMTGGMCYYLAIEFLLTPIVFLFYTFAVANENTATGAEQAGAAIGGFVLTVGAFVVGLPLAIALYLVARRLDTARGNES